MMDLPLNIDFSGKVVVVTGAGGVLCGTMAKAFAQAGAKVAALDLNEEAVCALSKECKNEGFVCEGYKANVLDTEALAQVHRRVLADLGPCDILVNGAGGNNPRATTDNEYHHEAAAGQKTFLIWAQTAWILYSSSIFREHCCRHRRLHRIWLRESPAAS